jgi:Na+-translocating ferredoxin:NAD+ oxidoreductase subunit B
MTKVEKIENILPQTQCELCDYAGCRPYAEAIVSGSAPIDKCLPGGEATLIALAQAMSVQVSTEQLQKIQQDFRPIKIAKIDEQICIGCAKCIKPCPTDAIVGSNKFMHSVIGFDCTGCEKCIPACPVDCISMQDRPEVTSEQKQHWQALHKKHRLRDGAVDKHRAINKPKHEKNKNLDEGQYRQLILDAITRKKAHKNEQAKDK